jgi:RNA recognition motif-containing protein
MGTKLFVGNLSYTTTREQVEELFNHIGPTVSVSLPVDRETKRPRGFAFIEYQTEEHAKEAQQRYDGYDLGGRKLRVNMADDRPRERTGGDARPGGSGPGRPRSGPGGGGGGGGYDRPTFMPEQSFDDSFGRGFDSRGGGGGGGRAKGSRRNVRAKKRSL